LDQEINNSSLNVNNITSYPTNFNVQQNVPAPQPNSFVKYNSMNNPLEGNSPMNALSALDKLTKEMASLNDVKSTMNTHPTQQSSNA